MAFWVWSLLQASLHNLFSLCVRAIVGFVVQLWRFYFVSLNEKNNGFKNKYLLFAKATLNSFMVYSRVQVLHTRLKFLAKTSIFKIIFFIFIFCVILNIPINLGRSVINRSFKIQSNFTTIVGSYGKKLIFKFMNLFT